MDRPDAHDLLDIARRTLIDRLIPVLPAEKHQTALLVASAMATAMRDLAAGETPGRQAAARLADIYGEHVTDWAETRARLEPRLAADIRAGAFDGDPERQDKVAVHLLATARDRALQANPRLVKP